jgi:hypothetical protein
VLTISSLVRPERGREGEERAPLSDGRKREDVEDRLK